jgi:hypothetical protein
VRAYANRRVPRGTKQCHLSPQPSSYIGLREGQLWTSNAMCQPHVWKSYGRRHRGQTLGPTCGRSIVILAPTKRHSLHRRRLPASCALARYPTCWAMSRGSTERSMCYSARVSQNDSSRQLLTCDDAVTIIEIQTRKHLMPKPGKAHREILPRQSRIGQRLE